MNARPGLRRWLGIAAPGDGLTRQHATPLLFAALIGVAPVAWSQVPSPRLASSCDECRVAEVPIIWFQTTWPEGSLAPLPASVARLGSSRWAVVDPNAREVVVFRADGAREPGVFPRGNGPGELARPMIGFQYEGDSLVIIDQGQGRMSVFDSAGTLGRSVPWTQGAFLRVLRGPEGTFTAPARINSRESFGMPLHAFDREGRLIRSFGASPDRKVVGVDDTPALRIAARSRADGTFWTVDAMAPRLRQWSHSGALLTDWQLQVDEFVPFVRMQPDSPFGAEFYSVEEDSEGLLVVVIAYRERRYRDAFGAPRVLDGRQTFDLVDWGRFMDSLVLVLDPRTRRLITSLRTDTFLAGTLGDGLYWGIRPGDDQGQVGVVRLKVTSTQRREDK